jgi:predicted NBD/HSP70 family sugar kinase
MDVYIGVDIGGSHLGVGFIDKNGNVLCSTEERIDDCRNCRPNQILDQIVNTIDWLSLKGHPGVAWRIKAVG